MSARSARKLVARPQVSKVEREVSRAERVLLGSQPAGPHRSQNHRRGGKNARGGRQAGERRAIAQG